MRDFLFRGFTPDENGKYSIYVNGAEIVGYWVQGSFWYTQKTTYCVKEDYEANPDNDEYYIIFDEITDWGLPNKKLKADVIPETVGQYTGLTDKSGKKIFEGDIAQVSKSNELYEIKFGEYMPNQWYRLMGEYTNDVSKYSLFGLYVKQIKGEFVGEDFVLPKTTELEVIGNIHDNPEVLEV